MGNAALAVQLLLGLLDRASAIGALLQKAQAEGRDITDEELDQAFADDSAERAKGQAVRDKAKAEGR